MNNIHAHFPGLQSFFEQRKIFLEGVPIVSNSQNKKYTAQEAIPELEPVKEEVQAIQQSHHAAEKLSGEIIGDKMASPYFKPTNPNFSEFPNPANRDIQEVDSTPSIVPQSMDSAPRDNSDIMVDRARIFLEKPAVRKEFDEQIQAGDPATLQALMEGTDIRSVAFQLYSMSDATESKWNNPTGIHPSIAYDTVGNLPPEIEPAPVLPKVETRQYNNANTPAEIPEPKAEETQSNEVDEAADEAIKYGEYKEFLSKQIEEIHQNVITNPLSIFDNSELNLTDKESVLIHGVLPLMLHVYNGNKAMVLSELMTGVTEENPKIDDSEFKGSANTATFHAPEGTFVFDKTNRSISMGIKECPLLNSEAEISFEDTQENKKALFKGSPLLENNNIEDLVKDVFINEEEKEIVYRADNFFYKITQADGATNVALVDTATFEKTGISQKNKNKWAQRILQDQFGFEYKEGGIDKTLDGNIGGKTKEALEEIIEYVETNAGIFPEDIRSIISIDEFLDETETNITNDGLKLLQEIALYKKVISSKSKLFRFLEDKNINDTQAQEVMKQWAIKLSGYKEDVTGPEVENDTVIFEAPNNCVIKFTTDSIVIEPKIVPNGQTLIFTNAQITGMKEHLHPDKKWETNTRLDDVEEFQNSPLWNNLSKNNKTKNKYFDFSIQEKNGKRVLGVSHKEKDGSTVYETLDFEDNKAILTMMPGDKNPVSEGFDANKEKDPKREEESEDTEEEVNETTLNLTPENALNELSNLTVPFDDPSVKNSIKNQIKKFNLGKDLKVTKIGVTGPIIGFTVTNGTLNKVFFINKNNKKAQLNPASEVNGPLFPDPIQFSEISNLF